VWLEKYYTINADWRSEDRRRLLAFARDLLNSDYAGHRLTFQLFAQSPPFAHLAAVYRNFKLGISYAHRVQSYQGERLLQGLEAEIPSRCSPTSKSGTWRAASVAHQSPRLPASKDHGSINLVRPFLLSPLAAAWKHNCPSQLGNEFRALA
jgi:hypothetical protein